MGRCFLILLFAMDGIDMGLFSKSMFTQVEGVVHQTFHRHAFSLHNYFFAQTGYGYGGGHYANSAFGCMAKGADTGQANHTGETLIAIKGTSSWADAETDLKILPTSLDGHMVHSAKLRY